MLPAPTHPGSNYSGMRLSRVRPHHRVFDLSIRPKIFTKRRVVDGGCQAAHEDLATLCTAPAQRRAGSAFRAGRQLFLAWNRFLGLDLCQTGSIPLGQRASIRVSHEGGHACRRPRSPAPAQVNQFPRH